ncbi:helix-turn-helix transcriptional regulator [Psychrobacillus psychrodurans]|uniref:helix-turn-helix transcriptional regulator n=1 Tax=Psychrobacillus psychrodurans TaxID=126157 RepID=UPI0008F0CB79|nr:YafY family protein [Psychrobacillus psychrodurans]MCZ8542470.1 YafY family transcriptional regulator [Psychrobacillus psychrodurans]SFN24359.1 Predicted DNA-binding transcriptional regulator YafY, contains an HTH and WYL domains [Psychrobacillus psychrodurans]
MIKIERLLSILVALLNKEVVSADELAKKLEVSKRTIYRDIESLGLSGLPVITIHGRNGGVGLMPSYKMDKYLFSDKEKLKIIESLRMQHNILQEDNQVLIEKLENLKGDESFSNLSFYSPTIHRTEIEQETKEKLTTLRGAISQKKKLKIKYISLNGDITSRVISPSNIVLTNGSWYLEAYCEKRKDRRMFKLTRIREHFLIDEKSIQMEGKEIDLTTIYEQAELIFHRNQLGKLYDFFLEEEIEIQNNYIKVNFKYDSNRNLIPFLLMFGSTVDVINPQTLKQEYYNELNKIHKKINDDNQLSYIP